MMKTMLVLAAASLIAVTGASAQMAAPSNTTMPAKTKRVRTPKAMKPTPETATPAPAVSSSPTKPAMAAAPAAPRQTMMAHKAAPAANGRMVSTTTKTGKKITYNCSKAGNMNKKACKG